MVIELKDTADKVFHNQFHRWRKRNPRGMFLSLATKTRANLHGVPCHHAGTRKWYAGDPSSLTKKLKVLEDGLGSLQLWASERGLRIHVCNDCLRNGYIRKHVDKPPGHGQDQSGDARKDRAIYARTDIGPTQKQTLVNARRGQGQFRARVMKLDGRCRVTGIRTAKHLHASHIKPWAHSTDAEKLDGNNGLMLAPHLDHLFDKGYISFSNVGQIIVSNRCAKGVLAAWGISRNAQVRSFRPAQRPFLEYHRKQVLLR
jgi:HNH endonuclease